MTNQNTADETSIRGFKLPQRPGAKPAVTSGIPHIQLDQGASEELMSELATWAFSLDGIVEQPSRASLPGARALTVATEKSAHSEAMIVGREFAHIHPQPNGGSLHLRLRRDEASEVVDKGWGEHHPFGLDGTVPNLIMVYAPRTADDLKIVMTIVDAAVEYALQGSSDR